MSTELYSGLYFTSHSHCILSTLLPGFKHAPGSTHKVPVPHFLPLLPHLVHTAACCAYAEEQSEPRRTFLQLCLRMTSSRLVLPSRLWV